MPPSDEFMILLLDYDSYVCNASLQQMYKYHIPSEMKYITGILGILKKAEIYCWQLLLQ